MKHINSEMVEQGLSDLNSALSVIPLDRAGVCVNCERVFTIIPGQITCPKCMSTAWRPVGAWLYPMVERERLGGAS